MTACILVIQPGEQGGTPWACLESGPPSPLLPRGQTSAMNNHPSFSSPVGTDDCDSPGNSLCKTCLPSW